MSRTVKLCRWEFKVNSLWLWFYCVLVLAGEGYLMYRAVMKCKDYNELPWDTKDKPVSELYVYIALIVISIMCVPFFVITAVFKVGSYSNDGTRLGRDNVLHHLNVDTPEGAGSVRAKLFKDIWRHIGPLCHTFHIVSGFVLLLPMVIIDAQKVKHGFLDPDKIWSSELDALFGKSVYTLDTATLNTVTNVTSGSSMYNTPPTQLHVEAGPVTMSPEFVNYILALIIYSLRYAGVYWYTNASFSVVFAIILLVSTLHNIFAYCGMGILYKFSINLHAVGSVSLILSNTAVVVLYLIACTIMFCSTLCIFNYGYCHYVECCRKFLKVHFPTYARYVAKMPVGCHGYIPHLFATISLVLYVVMRAPIVYDYVSVYRVTALPILLTCIVMDAFYMIVWIALWFMFTIKQTWEFKVNPQMDIVQQPQRNAIAMATRQNGQVQHAEVTVIGSTTRMDINRNNRQDPPGSAHPNGTTQNNYYNPQLVLTEQAKSEVLHADSEPKPVLEKDQFANNENPKITKPHKQDKPKLQPLNVDSSHDSSDTVDNPTSPQSPISPTSAMKKSGLRKSGERRHNAPQRVTFDDSVDQIVDDEVSNINSGSNNHPLQLSPKRKKKRDNNSHGKQRQHPEAMKPIPGYKYSTDDNTPENTLTRNYRSSLRDKCGQYYKHLGDVGIPPAAQSSPRPRDRPVSDSYEASPEEILLNPLTAGGHPSSKDNHSNSATLLSPVHPVSKDYFHQRAKSSDTAARPSYNNNNDDQYKLRDPKRLSARKSNDDSKAYSYPPQLSSPTKLKSKDSNQLNPANNPPPYAPRQSELNTHLKPNSYSITSSHSPNSNSTGNTSYDSYYPQLLKDPKNKTYLKLNPPYEQQHQQQKGGDPKAKTLPPHLIRPLNISTKPELNRRDSALPSSNETSSNESAENILCSQV